MAARVCAAAIECAPILGSDRLLVPCPAYTWHQGRATPALLKTALDQLAANAAPTSLRDVLQFVEQFQRASLIGPERRQRQVGRPDLEGFGQGVLDQLRQ